MKTIFNILFLISPSFILAQYSPGVGQPGCIAIHKDSSSILNWANEVVSINLGPQQASNVSLGLADFGN